MNQELILHFTFCYTAYTQGIYSVINLRKGKETHLFPFSLLPLHPFIHPQILMDKVSTEYHNRHPHKLLGRKT